MNEHQWQYLLTNASGDKLIGPIPEAKFIEAVKCGSVPLDCNVRSTTRTNGKWVPANSIEWIVRQKKNAHVVAKTVPKPTNAASGKVYNAFAVMKVLLYFAIAFFGLGIVLITVVSFAANLNGEAFIAGILYLGSAIFATSFAISLLDWLQDVADHLHTITVELKKLNSKNETSDDN